MYKNFRSLKKWSRAGSTQKTVNLSLLCAGQLKLELLPTVWISRGIDAEIGTNPFMFIIRRIFLFPIEIHYLDPLNEPYQLDV